MIQNTEDCQQRDVATSKVHPHRFIDTWKRNEVVLESFEVNVEGRHNKKSQFR
jgi:hypothetical protein